MKLGLLSMSELPPTTPSPWSAKTAPRRRRSSPTSIIVIFLEDKSFLGLPPILRHLEVLKPPPPGLEGLRGRLSCRVPAPSADSRGRRRRVFPSTPKSG